MKKKLIALLLGVSLLAAVAFAGCGSATPKQNDEPAATTSSTADEAKSDGIDYMVLVNKTHALPDDWEDKLETVHSTNTVGDDVETEKKAYSAYLELKAALEKENIFVDLDSSRRSVAEQQRIMDDFTKQYGADYAAKTVAKPGYSEHHTGLALDLYLIIDGKDITENEDMIQYPEIWARIMSCFPNTALSCAISKALSISPVTATSRGISAISTASIQQRISRRRASLLRNTSALQARIKRRSTTANPKDFRRMN